MLRGIMRGVYAVRITPDDVGQRVSVRARVSAAGGAGASDTVGRLRAWSDGVLSIERRDGSLAKVAEDRLLAAKVIPERPPRDR